jgi:ketosteroid isomerase-like protein
MMPSIRVLAVTVLASGLGACASTPAATSPEQLRTQVYETERAFANTMARRDLDAFAAFLAEDTVWFGGQGPLRGKQAVIDAWTRFYDPKLAPPFSWEPATVEVLESGTLALSSGPVRDPDGRIIATFTSIWRQEAPGQWRIIFDKGCDACPDRRR